MIAQWDSSQSVLPVARVMIAQWDSSLSVLPVARVQFPATAEYFKGFFPSWSHSANPSWASVAENGSISPQWVTFSMGHLLHERGWASRSWRLFATVEHPLIQCVAPDIQDRMDGPGRLGVSQPKPFVYTSPLRILATLNQGGEVDLWQW